MAEDGKASDHDGNEDNVDACTCGIELQESEATPDTQLPAATGGVVIAIEESPDEDEIDGCDAVPNDTKATTDEELPAATGGIG